MNGSGALFERHFTLAECGVECVAELLALAQRFEYGEFFRLDAAEVDGIVDAMHDKIDRLRLELGDGANVLFLALFGEGVAGEVGVFVFFADGEKKIVNRIGEIEQANIWLQLERERRDVGSWRDLRCGAAGLDSLSKASMSAHSRRAMSSASVCFFPAHLGCARSHDSIFEPRLRSVNEVEGQSTM